MVEQQQFVQLERFDVSSEAVRRLPVEFCLEKHAVVLKDSKTDEPVTVGMLHPDSRVLVEEISKKIGQPVKAVQINAFQLKKALSRGYEITDLELEKVPMLAVDSECGIEFDEPQTPTKILRDLLAEAVRMKASDIHIETHSYDMELRFRIDGVLHNLSSPLSLENINRVISKLKVMSDLDIAGHRRAQDGHFSFSYLTSGTSRRIDARLNIIPGPYGEEAAIRLLDAEQFILDFEQLGFNEQQLELYKNLISTPGGMILVVGPSGSGKTTTLYCSVVSLKDEEKKIITAEDPIEYEFENISQKQITKAMDFSDYTRAFLRQDPDIILIGEIRDRETTNNCIRAANTGHLVLSTLHTGNAVMAISRLRSLGAENDYLAEVLNGVVSQRLVRILCDNCKQEIEPDSELIKRFYTEKPEHKFYGPGGCEKCQNRGYRGRTGVFEILIVDREIKKMIASNAPTQQIHNYVAGADFQFIHHHALDKVARGITSLAEVNRVIMPPYLF
ncbi:MAG: GspE/PulE family protein [bacterium]